MKPEQYKPALPFGEFVALMALLMALVSFAIDSMLPALTIIASDLKAAKANDSQLIVTMFYLGLAAGQLFCGPLSDSFGRKPVIAAGVGVFVIGCLLSIFAVEFWVMLCGRVLQGVGLGAPRIVATALIRDQYEGRTMAQVMSFVMTIFILVPMVAPIVGQAVLLLFDWRAVFVLMMTMGLFAVCWLLIRQPETLKPSQRISFSPYQISCGVREILGNRVALGYTLVAGFISGAFLIFLSTLPQVIQLQYGLGQLFPFVFAGLVLAVGIANFINGRLVMRLGMQLMTQRAQLVSLVASMVFFVIAYLFSGHPPLWMLICYLLVLLFCKGILFGNVNALAMQPLGHIAGVGAAVVGSLSSFIALTLAIFIGRTYDGSVLPLIAGFVFCGFVSLLLMLWVERGSRARLGRQ